MNHVFLTGVVTSNPIVLSKENESQHVQFVISVSHKNTSGQKRVEKYPIQAWNKIASWSIEHLNIGRMITVSGYLTRRPEIGIAAREIILGEQKKLSAQINSFKGSAVPEENHEVSAD